jgi:hypothetical protein
MGDLPQTGQTNRRARTRYDRALAQLSSPVIGNSIRPKASRVKDVEKNQRAADQFRRPATNFAMRSMAILICSNEVA